jgi:mannose/fructose/N-acetylgalactosamine-specific phosphotransferase system component IIB
MSSAGTGLEPDWGRLALVRVDDRFLHGQVVLNWMRALWPRRVVIADDALANDDLGRVAVATAAPPGIEVWIGGIDEAAYALMGGAIDPEGTMVLVGDPVSARRLFDAGVRYQRLNVGGVGQAPGRERVGRQVSLTREEWEALRYLERAGVKVTLQALPSDGAVALARVRRPREWSSEAD